MFIPALLVSTCAVALYEKLEAISEEGAITCVAVGLVSIVTTLLVAPWQFHLLLVLVIVLLKLNPANRLPLMGRLAVLKSSFALRASLFKRSR